MADDRITYKASCHCGATRLDARLPEIQSAVTCNCSLCRKKGTLWVSFDEENVAMTRVGSLNTFKWAAGEHQFCQHCGTSLVGCHSSGPLAGQKLLNAGSILGLNPFTLVPVLSDGQADEKPEYISPVFSGTLPSAEGEATNLYTGSCHCGNVQIALRSKPLPQVEVKQDNCSICVRTGGALVYPDKSQVSIIGKDNTTEYAYGRKFNGFPFCATCGVLSFLNLHGPPKEVLDRLPGDRKDFVAHMLRVQPVNIRVLDGVEWDEIKVVKEHEGTEGYALSE